MSAAELLTRLRERGITLEADGEKLRFYPREAVTAAMLAELKALKGEVLDLLRNAPEGAEKPPTPEKRGPSLPRAALEVVNVSPNTYPKAPSHEASEKCGRCGSEKFRDIPIHNGQSTRRDCQRCGRFHSFPQWYSINPAELN